MPSLSMLKTGLSAVAFAAVATGALACDQYDAAVVAVEESNTAEAARLYDQIAVSPDCDDAIRKWVASYLARERFNAAIDLADPSAREQALDQSLTYQKHWRAFAALGQIGWDGKDYAKAAENFQLAINEIDEGDPTDQVTNDEIAQLVQLASASMALADVPIAPPKTRSGEVGGVFKTKIRGFTVEEVSLPITFEYDSTEFDATGKAYADELADYLESTGISRVRLVGHTDPRGDENYNLQLSEDRAEALGAYLKERGVTTEFDLAGAGETDLPVVPEGIAPDTEEYYRIARRVVFSVE